MLYFLLLSWIELFEMKLIVSVCQVNITYVRKCIANNTSYVVKFTRVFLWRLFHAKRWYFELADNSFEIFVTARFTSICAYMCTAEKKSCIYATGREKRSLSLSTILIVLHEILNEMHFCLPFIIATVQISARIYKYC